MYFLKGALLYMINLKDLESQYIDDEWHDGSSNQKMGKKS